MKIKHIQNLLDRIKISCLDTPFQVKVHEDKTHGGRLYLQANYSTKCVKTGELGNWTGRKNYLSDYMTEDEVIKTAYVTFKQAVEHEIMEGFKVDDIILFNPHVSFEALLSVSHKEIKRK